MRNQTSSKCVTRTLRRAARASGGLGTLAAKLAVPVSELKRWIAGIPPPPGVLVYIAALNIVSAGPFNEPPVTKAVRDRATRRH